jgi:hypothetical protein
MPPTQGRLWHNAVAISVVVLWLLVSVMLTVAQAGSGDPHPHVVPLTLAPSGNTYGEWSARWWQWTLSIPAATNPALDETGANCAEGQSGQVWFLAGSFGGTFERACPVPTGKALFFPILNAAFGAAVGDCEPTGAGPCHLNTLRAAAAASMDPVTIETSIDGVPLRHLTEHRVQSPVFSVTLPEGNIPEFLGVNAPSGTYAPMVSDGYWLMLAPLSAGAHTIQVQGIITGGVFEGFASNVTYHLTVGSEAVTPP